ncbi:MAG: adenylate/guanylate cyclase domain-containing protein [Actinobacteria bacterium]|nr:MAG: adenylate/guanylate cyclase domain-containing protein [Actinomycetota bacterium]
MDVPETWYARSGDVNIAYQVAGDGPFDVVFVPGYVSHVELGWETPRHGDLRRRLASFARLIVFDKRGTGMSDPVDGVPSLETRMDDLRGVMDAAGSKRAAIIGLEEGVPMSVLFAATYPERTAALVLWGGYARAMWAPDYPWGWTAEAYRGLLEADLELFGPRDKAVDLFTRRFGEGPAENVDYYRHCVSPSMMIALNRMNAEIDVRPVLPAIRVPTLVIHGDSDRVVPVEASRYLAERIPAARAVELAGVDHLPAGADLGRLCDELERFLVPVCTAADADEEVEPESVLATVLFTDLVGSTAKAAELGDRGWRELLEQHHGQIRGQLARFRGVELDTAGDGFFARFDGPARAIRCACAAREAVAELGLEIRAGLHTGECELLDGKVTGIAVSIGARVAAEAGPGEVLVSSTVKDLVAGSGLEFEDRGLHELKGVPGEWRLYSVATRA